VETIRKGYLAIHGYFRDGPSLASYVSMALLSGNSHYSATLLHIDHTVDS